jgi:3-oxoacyl-[acyl-carrier protein] reductase
MSFKGKVFLVTGSTKGIGKAVIERVAADGANVVINYSSNSALADELVSKIGSDRALAVKADVSNISEIEMLVQATVEKFGRIDCLMANAACAPMNDLESTTEETFDKSFNLNVKGPYFLVQVSIQALWQLGHTNNNQKAVPHMPRDGRVILVSSGVLHQSQVAPRYLLYASTKGSVEQMTRILAKDLGPRGITVNAIAPGPTATEMFFQGKSQELIDTIAGFSPLGRLGKPEEIAEVAAFLAGPGSSWVSGQVIGANGGSFV